MRSILKHMAILDDWYLADGNLCLRFTPDYFDLCFDEPVLVVETELDNEPEGLERQIQIMQEGLIDDVEVDETQISVWIEHLDSPVRFAGSTTWTSSGYETRDFLKAIETHNWIRSQQQDEISDLRRTIIGSVSFIDQLVERIEKKQQLSQQGNPEYRRQIDLLRRVRRKLKSDP